MIFHEYYADVPPSEIDRLLAEVTMGRLVTVRPAGVPQIGLYNFVPSTDRIELHLASRDPQVAALRAQPGCLFEVDRLLSIIPSFWEDPENASGADSFYQCVIHHCVAQVIDDPLALAEHLRALLERYQPSGGYRPVAADEPLYASRIRQLSVVRLRVERVSIKFKLGQQLSEKVRLRILDRLRERATPLDLATAAAVEATLQDSRTPTEA